MYAVAFRAPALSWGFSLGLEATILAEPCAVSLAMRFTQERERRLSADRRIAFLATLAVAIFGGFAPKTSAKSRGVSGFASTRR
jgi:hypothetical protein